MRRHAIILGVVLLALASTLSYAQAPVPFINLPLVPDAVAPGGEQFTLTVNGTGFASNSVVNLNGGTLATQFVSSSTLTAIVPAAKIAKASTGWVSVVNPAPGGGTSNTAFFTVRDSIGTFMGFTLASSPATGNSPMSVAAGDFNGDGNLDLAVANFGDAVVSILIGDGKGNFTPASSPVASANPRWVSVGDFNGDGKLDFVVTNPESSMVSILMGDGTGNFTLASTPATGYIPFSVAVGDFNGDGKLDLAVSSLDNVVSILLGDGMGNFTLTSSPATGASPVSVAVGDFNEDDKLDLAIANVYSNTVSVLLGDGRGNFSLVSSPTTGTHPQSVAISDFNGDGKLDLAVANLDSGNTVSVLLGDGTGNFSLASSTAAGSAAFSVAVGDFNGDSKPDLAATINCLPCAVSILLGDGTGNFTFVSSTTVGVEPRSVAVGEFNGDGILDLAVANEQDNTVSILLGVPPTPTVTLSSSSLSFGTQLIGTSSASQLVTLTNSGSATLTITSITGSVNFPQTNNCGSSLKAGASCTTTITFQPRGTGTLTGTVTITDNAANSPQTVALTGVGTAVTLLPSRLSFSNQTVGTTSKPQTATLTNYGKGALRISGIQISGSNPALFAQTNNCGTSVSAGGTCAISVTFSPKSRGAKSATLNVRDDGGASPQKVSLTGTGK